MALSRGSSFASWPSDGSQDDVQSVDSGVDSDSLSPSSEAIYEVMASTHATNDEISISQISEALPNLLYKGPVHPNTAVPTAPTSTTNTEEQRLQTSTTNIGTLSTQHQILMPTQPVEGDLQQEQPNATATSSTIALIQDPEQKTPRELVYDIATLLELGKGPSVTSKAMEFGEGDIKENVFKAFPKQDHARLRGLSNVSNTSTLASEVMEPEEQIVFLSQVKRSQRKPMRQPYGPPQSSLAQQHAGFARFLREHASPPHHRVTAGGRIVPNGPLSPPPMFRLDTIDSIVQSHASGANSPRVPRSAITSSFDDSHAKQFEPVSAGLTDPKPGPINASSKQQGRAAPLRIATNTSESFVAGIKAQTQPSIGQSMLSNVGAVLQLPQGAVPTMALPEGGLIVNFEGRMYRATLDRVNNTILEPLQVMVQPPDIQQLVSPYPPATVFFPGVAGFTPVPMLHSPQIPAHPMPLADMTNGANLSQPQQSTQLQIRVLQNHYDSLRSQLEALDRYVALYRHELSPMNHASMVTARMQLVQQLDSARVSKEQLERSISIAVQNPGLLQPLHMLQASQTVFEQYGLQNLQVPASIQPDHSLVNGWNHMMGVAAPVTPQVPHGWPGQRTNNTSNGSSKTPTIKGQSKNSKCLSPDAPTFVPNNTPASASRTGSKMQVLSAEQILPVADTHQIAHAAASNLTTQAQSLSLIITQDDVEYVDRLGFNDEPGPKRYCSTIADFQEAIRRVREQARMYGCAGGQSKDPEHDAEEDIRWAMSDKDAIPLPTKIPDHVANPRPWNWADSAFNIRADEEAYFANPVRLKHGANNATLNNCTTNSWGANNNDHTFAATKLTRQDSWESLAPGTLFGIAPCDLASVSSFPWGNAPSAPTTDSAVGTNNVWGKPLPTQALSSGGAPPPQSSSANANHSTFDTTINANTAGEGYDDGWNTPVRSTFWPNMKDAQDNFVDDGWNTPPPSIFTALTTEENWGSKNPYLQQRKSSESAASEKNHQYTEASAAVQEPADLPTRGDTYAYKTTDLVEGTGQHETGQPLFQGQGNERSNRKPYQAYVEDVVDTPTGGVFHSQFVVEAPSSRTKEGAWYGDRDKDDDGNSVDSWGNTREEREYAISQPLSEHILEILRRPGFMDSPSAAPAPLNQAGSLDQGKAFKPSEVKAVRIPSPVKDPEANPFYRNIIKDPHYSVAGDNLTPRNGGSHDKIYSSGTSANKWNQNVQTQASPALRNEDIARQGRSFSLASNIGTLQQHQVHKAPSSIAAPVYHAHGHLAPYDGAAHSLALGRTNISPRRGEPSRAILGGGVSIAGPPVGRADRFHTGRYDAGDHIFRSLREQEREEMARYKPLNPPNWQA